RSKRLYWGPAVAMPTSWVPRMLKAVERSSRPYDQRLSDWTFSTDTPVYYSNPSLVDHRDAPSTITDKPQPARRAVRYGEPAAWNTDAVYLGRQEGLVKLPEGCYKARNSFDLPCVTIAY